MPTRSHKFQYLFAKEPKFWEEFTYYISSKRASQGVRERERKDKLKKY